MSTESPAQSHVPAASADGAPPWSLAAADVLAQLDASPEGLSSSQARARMESHGPNELPRRAPERAWHVLLRQLTQPLVYVLVVAAVISAAIEHPIDAGVIAAVVLLNAAIGFVQEYRASREMDALLGLVAERCRILRDGEPREIASPEVVPGDVLLLGAGEKVPADARLLATRGLFVDEALLTGESVPVEKLDDGRLLEPDVPLSEQRSMLFSGTLATAGQARAVIVATGAGTELARISELVGAAQAVDTPLTKKIAAFSRVVTWAILALAACTFALTLLRDYEPVDGFLAAVALAVAAIPEGLPAIITIALALGLRRMAARNAVVRHLPAVEALGSTTVICSDKTGTLTRNEMVATEVLAGDHVTIEGIGYAPSGEFAHEGRRLDRPPEPVLRALEAGLLCSDARLVARDGVPDVEGDPTEGALVVAAAKAGLDRQAAERRRPRVDELPFESERRFMGTLHAEPDGRRAILKGAPEAILARCAGQAWPGRFDPPALLREADALAARGLRVLAVADKTEPSTLRALEHADLEDGFRLLGFVGLLDPPREDAIDAVAACRRAGVRVVMITGDHPATAAAIAQRMGIAGAGETAVTGRDLDVMTGEDLERVAAHDTVFARVAPEHKLRLVLALQHRGEVVAMTGDGVNDAPALKQADIGVAMGVTGTDVSKEAADIVLRDDDFSTIRAAVEEGRRVFDNLVKAIVFILPTNAGEALLVLGAIAAGLTLPLLPVHVLWVNAITAVALALPLAVEAREHDIMRRPPRRPGAPILDRVGAQRIVLVGILMFAAGVALFEVQRARGVALDEARTLVVTLIVLMEAAYLLATRSLRGSLRDIGLFSNPWVFAGIALVVVLQVAFVHLPGMNTLFTTAPIDPLEWLVALLLALTVLPVVAVHKRLAAH